MLSKAREALLIACIHALERDKHGVPLQVKGEEDGVSNVQVVAAEARLCLVGLEAAESGDVRLFLGGAHDGIGALLAEFVAEQAGRESIAVLSAAPDT